MRPEYRVSDGRELAGAGGGAADAHDGKGSEELARFSREDADEIDGEVG